MRVYLSLLWTTSKSKLEIQYAEIGRVICLARYLSTLLYVWYNRNIGKICRRYKREQKRKRLLSLANLGQCSKWHDTINQVQKLTNGMHASDNGSKTTNLRCTRPFISVPAVSDNFALTTPFCEYRWNRRVTRPWLPRASNARLQSRSVRLSRNST